MSHDFEPLSGRCIHCGTQEVYHMTVPGGTPCPQQGTPAVALRPEPARRQYAVDDNETIRARMVELDAARVALLNRAGETD